MKPSFSFEPLLPHETKGAHVGSFRCCRCCLGKRSYGACPGKLICAILKSFSRHANCWNPIANCEAAPVGSMGSVMQCPSVLSDLPSPPVLLEVSQPSLSIPRRTTCAFVSCVLYPRILEGVVV